VLRLGEAAGDFFASETTQAEVVAAMTGLDLEAVHNNGAGGQR
jgi:hypothetical protein